VGSGGQGITTVGLVITDAAGAEISTVSVPLPPPASANVRVGIPLGLPLSRQGQTVGITAFATDVAGRTGYAVRATVVGSESVKANGLIEPTEIVYGETFTMPIQGVVGDLVVDTLRGNVFLSNKSRNRLEVWANATQTFDPH